MKAGVSTAPWAVRMRPRRAGPVWASIVKDSGTENMVLVQCHLERSEGSAPPPLGGSYPQAGADSLENGRSRFLGSGSPTEETPPSQRATRNDKSYPFFAYLSPILAG